MEASVRRDVSTAAGRTTGSVRNLIEMEFGDDGCVGVLVELERGVVVAICGLEVNRPGFRRVSVDINAR